MQENDQVEFKSNLREIKKKETKNIDQKSKKIECIKLKCFTKQGILLLSFCDDYSLMVSEANRKATKGTGLKILTPKQMLQIIRKVLAQVKAGNNSENLLNEIRKMVFSLFQSKKITRKVYNSIIK